MVGAVADLHAATANVRTLRPDVVLIDQAMSESLAVIRAIRLISPDTKIVALAVPEMDQHVVACAEAGVAGYVRREAGMPELVETLQSVGRGELLCSPKMAATLLKRVAALAAGGAPIGSEPRLTTREIEILGLLEQGFSNKDIARNLGIEIATAKNHVHNILEKLGVNRRHQAAARVRGLRYPSTHRGTTEGRSALI